MCDRIVFNMGLKLFLTRYLYGLFYFLMKRTVYSRNRKLLIRFQYFLAAGLELLPLFQDEGVITYLLYQVTAFCFMVGPTGTKQTELRFN